MQYIDCILLVLKRRGGRREGRKEEEEKQEKEKEGKKHCRQILNFW